MNLPSSLNKFGQIHWYLVHADSLMQEKKFIPHPPGKIYTPTRTTFGKEVGNDEINWWVFNREKEIPQLRKRTESALTAAQTLKEGAEKLAHTSYASIDNLILAFEKFAIRYQAEIDEIFGYVEWLNQKDELAPTLLFNFRTWGSTRMADRIIETSVNGFPELSEIEQLTLIVLGISKRGMPRIILEEAYLFDELDDLGLVANNNREENENYQRELEQRTAFQAALNFAEYFEHIRDSLRNVLIDIEQRETQDRLLTSDDFWRSFILIATKSTKTEQKYWDFKQTLDMWHIKNEPAKSEKAHDFAERVAGFANNTGGVLLVGITDNPPRQIAGLGTNSRDIENYMKYTRQVIGKYIEHTPEFVHLQQVNVPDAAGVTQLCLVIAIQRTHTALAVKGLDGRSYSYPFREETGLVWKDQNFINNQKTGLKSDNFDFLRILQQFVNEEAV